MLLVLLTQCSPAQQKLNVGAATFGLGGQDKRKKQQEKKQ
jgi:hypothetical protein